MPFFNDLWVNHILIPNIDKVYFRDLDIYVHSSVDGQLDIVADLTVNVAGTLEVQTLNASSTLTASSDVIYSGAGSGVPYGCLDGMTESVACTSANTYYQVTFDTAGPSNLVTLSTDNNDVTITKTGVYQINVTACFHSAVASDFELLVCKNDGPINGTALAPHLFQTTAVSNKVENSAGSCMSSLTAGDTIELWIQCTSSAGRTAVFDHVSLSIQMVGG